MNGLLNIHPKVAGGSFSGALSLIVLWGLSYVVVVPTNVAAAFAVVLTGLGAYLAPVLKHDPPAAPK